MKLHLFALFAATLLLASCASPLTTQTPSPNQGILSLSVPHLGLWTNTAGSASPAGGRALVVADKVTFVVKDSSNTVVDTWSQTITANTSDLTPPAGHGSYAPGVYTVGLEVFNLSNSATVPTVTGTSPAITIVSNTATPVSITCVPKNPQPLEVGTTLAGQSLGAHWVIDGTGSVTTHGGEAWFSFIAASDFTKITLSPAANVLAMSAVYDASGVMVARNPGVSYPTGTPRSLTFSTTAGATYYVIGANGGNADGTADILAAAYTPANVVGGTVTLPATVSGKPFLVAVDTDTDGGNGYLASVTGSVTGSSFNYAIPDVAAGTYYVYAVVNQGASGAPVKGDYYGFYGYGGNPGPMNAAVGASGTSSFAITTVVSTGATATPPTPVAHSSGDLTTAFAAWTSSYTNVSGAVTNSGTTTRVTASHYVDAATGYTVDGVMTIVNSLETGTISYTGGPVKSITYHNVNTSGTSGTATIVFADTTTTYTFNFSNHSLTVDTPHALSETSAVGTALQMGRTAAEAAGVGGSGTAYISVDSGVTVYHYKTFVNAGVTLNGTVYCWAWGDRVGDFAVSGDAITHLSFSANPQGTSGVLTYTFSDLTQWKHDLGTGGWTQVTTTSTTGLTAVPASADGTWSTASGPVFTLASGVLVAGSSTGVSLVFDALGNLSTSFGGETQPLTGYTWNGSVFLFNGTALTKAAVAPAYTNLPAAADGTWSLGGTPLLTIANSSMVQSGQTIPLQYDAAGQLYYLIAGSATPMTGYTWNGTALVTNGMALTKATVLLNETFASANGTWSTGASEGQASFTIANNAMTLNTGNGTTAGRITVVVPPGTIPAASRTTVVFRANPNLVLGVYKDGTSDYLFIDLTGPGVGVGHSVGGLLTRSDAALGLALDPSKDYQVVMVYNLSGSLTYTITQFGSATVLKTATVTLPANFITTGGLYLQTYSYTTTNCTATIRSVTIESL